MDKEKHTFIEDNCCGPLPIGIEIKRISNMIRRCLNEQKRRNNMDDVTAVHGWVIRYLYDHRDRDVYQKDIEKDFSITKASVTNVLKLMEEKGYIRREAVPGDARLKRIVLTEEGIKIHLVISSFITEMDEMIDSIIGSDSDREQFRNMLVRLEEGLSEYLDGGNRE